MLNRIKDFELFSKFWIVFSKYARGEGFDEVILLKFLADQLELEDGLKFASCLNHWLVNITTDEQRKLYIAICNDLKIEVETVEIPKENSGVYDFEIK